MGKDKKPQVRAGGRPDAGWDKTVLQGRAGSKRGSAPMLRILDDLPLATEEGLGFDFEAIASVLAEIARNGANRTPMTVVLKADWGRGKTTLMRQIQRQLEPEQAAAEEVEWENEASPNQVSSVRQVATLWFNVWKYPDEERVLAGLLGALIDKFRQGTMSDQLKILVDENKDRLARSVLKTAAPWFFKEEGSGRYDEVLERRALVDRFDDLWKQVMFLWWHASGLRDKAHVPVGEELAGEQEERVFVVFLDDLDRCSDQRIVETLQAIYLFQDLPGVIFFLGLDWNRLTEILQDEMGDRGEDFLEKMVQIVYPIPEVDEEGASRYIETLAADSGLEAMLGENGLERLLPLGKELSVRHPRHLKRFLNDLSVSIAVLGAVGSLRDQEEGEGVPAQSVLALHALGWIAKEDGASFKTPTLLRDYLRRFEGEDGQVDKKPGAVCDAAWGLRGSQEWIFDRLRNLEDGQLRDLTSLGSPSLEPKAPQERGRRRRTLGLLGDLASLDSPAWVSVEGGRLTMGDEEIADASFPVELTSFHMSRYPVTNSDYSRYCRDSEARLPAGWEDAMGSPGLENHPVVGISWPEANDFCRWLAGTIDSGSLGSGDVDLPTEAQWEFAARGAEGRRYPWGEAEPTEEHANFAEHVGSTTPVDRYARGATPETEICDLAGNVWEWCRDWYGPYPEEPKRNYGGPENGSRRVLRGGAFNLTPKYLRAAFRSDVHPEGRDRDVGFRVVWLFSGGP